MTEQLLSFDGTPIAYECHGPEIKMRKNARNPTIPIVFCYGLVCAMTHWRHQIAWFKKNHLCVLLDYRGHHRSGMPPPESITIENCTKDVLAVMDRLELKEAHLAGHSMGSNVALMLAYHHPERVRSVVSICSSPSNPFETMFHTTLFQHVFDTIKKAHSKQPDLVEKLWKLMLQNNALNRAVVATTGFNRRLSTSHDIEVYLEGVRQVPLSVLSPLLEDMARNPLTPFLEGIQTPTLVVSGENDLVQPPVNQRILYERIPKAQWLSIPYGSHCAHVDMAEFVNLRMEKFFAETEQV